MGWLTAPLPSYRTHSVAARLRERNQRLRFCRREGASQWGEDIGHEDQMLGTACPTNNQLWLPWVGEDAAAVTKCAVKPEELVCLGERGRVSEPLQGG